MSVPHPYPAFEISPATPEEVPQIVAVHRQTYLETYIGVTPEITSEAVKRHLGGDWAERKEAQLQEAINTGEASVWSARVGGAVVGFCTAPPGWCEGLYVRPDCQAKGIGTALLASALSHTWDVNRPINLWVVPGIEAEGFYERVGFIPTGRDLSSEYPRLRGGETLPQLELSLSPDNAQSALRKISRLVESPRRTGSDS